MRRDESIRLAQQARSRKATERRHDSWITELTAHGYTVLPQRHPGGVMNSRADRLRWVTSAVAAGHIPTDVGFTLDEGPLSNTTRLHFDHGHTDAVHAVSDALGLTDRMPPIGLLAGHVLYGFQGPHWEVWCSEDAPDE